MSNEPTFQKNDEGMIELWPLEDIRLGDKVLNVGYPEHLLPDSPKMPVVAMLVSYRDQSQSGMPMVRLQLAISAKQASRLVDQEILPKVVDRRFDQAAFLT